MHYAPVGRGGLCCACLCSGSSSGLHHDFHDNLYVLLRGAKRFRLYPPSAVRGMYTHGRLAALHDNGRIVYQGQVWLAALHGKARQGGIHKHSLFERVDTAPFHLTCSRVSACRCRQPERL